MKLLNLIIKRIIQWYLLQIAIVEANFNHFYDGRQYMVKVEKGKYHVIGAWQVRTWNKVIDEVNSKAIKEKGDKAQLKHKVDVRQFKDNAVYITR